MNPYTILNLFILALLVDAGWINHAINALHKGFGSVRNNRPLNKFDEYLT